MLRRKAVLMTLLSVWLALGTGCVKEVEYEAEGPFLIMARTPAGPDDMRNLFTRYIAVYDDGKIILYTEPTGRLNVGDDVPVYERQLEAGEVMELKQLLEKNNFWKMKEDVSDLDVMDGILIEVTVNLVDDSKTVGGWNPDHPEFVEIADNVYEIAVRAGYADWVEEMTEHLFEWNPD